MRIVEYSELTSHQRRLAVGVDVSDGGSPSGMERLDRVRFGGERLLRYESLYAVEGGVPLARVGSTRNRFVTAEGSEIVCGVSDVITRPDGLRRGYATRLMEETHRRARAEGLRWAFLWTRRSWGAHRAYERLGYREVYASALVTQPPAARRSRGRPRLAGRVARRSDAALLDRLLAAASADRTGFSRRPPRWFEGIFRLGWTKPGTFRILYADRRPVGYVRASVDRFDVVSSEIVVPRAELQAPALDYLETLAQGRWLAIASTTFLRDAAGEVARRGYDRVPFGHGVMMACPLVPVATRDWRELRRTTAGPRFWLHAGDMV
jgi:GNAT superfamily N-acetyltransferase